MPVKGTKDVATAPSRSRVRTIAIDRFTSTVRHARTGELVVGAHGYDKLVVPDALLAEQFADAGLELTNAGRVADLSPYHRERIRRVGDLGMLGEPDCLYRAVKETTRHRGVAVPTAATAQGAPRTRGEGSR